MRALLGGYKWLLIAVWMLAALHAPTQAAPLAAADEKKIQAVVQAQLDAFAADDATRAFSYASPDIRKMSGSAENFMAMVRSGYPAVYRPASVLFLKPEMADKEVIQRVQLIDAQGAGWLAFYTMQRQKDRSWRIGGCSLQPHKGRMA